MLYSSAYRSLGVLQIRHHFIRDSNEKKLIQMIKIHTDQNVADLLTKAFDWIIHEICLEWHENAAKDEFGVSTEKSSENDDFAQIVDFLNTHPIRYTLTVNPTIYVSYIEQFWSTAKAKIINEETQIHATVDGKKIVITQSSVRSDLQLADDDGIDFHTKKVFANMRRKGKEFSGKVTPLFETMLIQPQAEVGEGPRKAKRPTKISQSSRPIPLVADETVTKEWEDRMERDVTTTSSLEAEQDSGAKKPYWGGAAAQTRVLALETTKTAQAKEIASLKKRVKKLERKRKSRTPGRTLFKIGTSKKRSLGEEDASKQGKNLKQRSIFGESDVDEDLDAVSTAKMEVNTAEPITTASAPINTAGVSVSTAEPSTPLTTTTTIIEDEDLTIAQTLMKMKSEKSKAKGVTMQEPTELEEEERLAKQREEDANITEWDNVQAMMDADYEIAARLQAEEQGEISIEKRSRLFVELMDKRKKHFAKLGAKEQRRKPPTKTQKRNIMSTYLKNMAGYKHTQLKNKSFEEIQMLFEKEMKKSKHICRYGCRVDEEFIVHDIPLAVKPASIVGFQIHRAGRQGSYEIIRANGSTKTYTLFSQLIKEFNKEDLENLWKLVKTKHGYTRPEEAYERVLWGDLKVMFEPDVEDDIWRNLQGQKILFWKLYDSCGIHFMRFENMHIYMLVEKRYPLSPATITDMLNRKLQADY
ncbi:hypothetical protein Tco_0211870 [Tanacetum coccineum]